MHLLVSLTQCWDLSHHITVSKHIKMVSHQHLERQPIFVRISNKHLVPVNKMFGPFMPKVLSVRPARVATSSVWMQRIYKLKQDDRWCNDLETS